MAARGTTEGRNEGDTRCLACLAVAEAESAVEKDGGEGRLTNSPETRP